MYISGDGITTYRARIKPGFKVNTVLSLNWIQTSDGNFKCTDRGSTVDYYEAEIDLIAKEEEINQFVSAVYNNRFYDSNHFSMSGFESTEHVFGEDVDHSGAIDVTVLEVSNISQPSWKVRSVTAKVRALSPSFVGTASLPVLRCLDIGYNVNIENTNVKYDSYTGAFTYLDREADVGLFEGVFTLSIEDMRSIRRYLTIERGGDIIIPAIHGVEYPFGPYRSSTYPITVKVIEWKDLGMWGVNDWKLKLVLAEVV